MSELPLVSPWERQAVKVLTQSLYLLSHGDFTSPVDLANWLKTEAEALALLGEGESEATAIYKDIMAALTYRPDSDPTAAPQQLPPSPDEPT